MADRRGLLSPIDVQGLLAARSQGLLGTPTAQMRAYQPTLAERIGNFIFDRSEAIGMPRAQARKMRDAAQFATDMTPAGAETAGRDIGAGNYLSGGLGLAAAFIPGAVAEGAVKRFPYHRFTRGANPDNGVGFMMFAGGDPDRVRHYGSHHWVTDPTDMPAGSVVDASDPEVQQAVADMLRDNWDEVESMGFGHTSPEELASELAPNNIVDSAQFWDSDLVGMAWERVFEPLGVAGVKTPDGFISFDPRFVRRGGG